MDINQLLNPDAGCSYRDSCDSAAGACAPNKSQSPRSDRRRSEFIGLVTESAIAPEKVTSESEGAFASDSVTLDGLRSAVNESKKYSYTTATTYLPGENLISSITTPALSDASASSLTSPTSPGRRDLAFQLPVGSISIHSRDSSCGSCNMVPARVGRAESTKDTEESPIALTSGRQEEVTGRALDRTVGSDDSEYDAATDASEDGDFKPSTAYKSWEDVPMEFRCTFVEGCVLDSPDRKVISHFFGRNKKCTRAIPESVWAPFCRRHYQRTRYRNVDNFGGVQMDLVRRTVENLQVWGGVANFELILRKRAMQAIRQEEFGDDKQETLHAAGVQPSPDLATKRNTETWLVPYLGKNKAFEDILEFVDLIEEHVKEHNCKPPEFEILPSYQPGYMRLPEAKKSLKQTAKPAGVKKRASHPNVKLSRAGALLKEVGEPKTTPQITPSVPSRNPETHSGRGTLVRGRPLRATGTIPPQGLFHRPTRSSSS